MKHKLQGLTRDLYELACNAQNLEARLAQVQDMAGQVEYQLREIAYTHNLKEDILVGNLVVCFSGRGIKVVSEDEYEKGAGRN